MIWVLCTVPQKFPGTLGLCLSSSCIECVDWNLHQSPWKNGIHSSLLPEEPNITKPITWIPLPLTLSLKPDSRVKESAVCRPPRFPTNSKVWVLALPIAGSKFQSIKLYTKAHNFDKHDTERTMIKLKIQVSLYPPATRRMGTNVRLNQLG